MRVVLRIISEQQYGKTYWMRPGQAIVFGRTEFSDIAFPWDGHMSGTHFVVTCDLDTCRLRDLQSSSGTTINGQRVCEQVLADGDRVVAGTTEFVVEMEEPAGCCDSMATAASTAPVVASTPTVAPAINQDSTADYELGMWRMQAIKDHWIFRDGEGLRRSEGLSAVATLGFEQSAMPAESSLRQRAASLAESFQGHLDKVQGPLATTVGGSEESYLLRLYHPEMAGVRLVQVVLLVRTGDEMGSANLLGSLEDMEETEQVLEHLAVAPAAQQEKESITVAEPNDLSPSPIVLESNESC